MDSDQEKTLSRRGFVGAGLSAGFALAAQPVRADTLITTDATGISVGEATIQAEGRAIPGHWAAPAKPTGAPTVMVIHEIFGVHEWVKDVCRRLAKAGYFAVAPDLYVRQGNVIALADIEQVMGVVRQVPDAQVASDLDATRRWAESTGSADTAKLAVTGFCWGGRETWLYAAHNPKVKAAVAWYGPLNGPTNDLKPVHPVDIAAKLTVPVRGLYGGAESGIPQSVVDEMKGKLPKSSEFIVYPDAPHGFAADYRPSYREGPAKDGWTHMLDWFKSHGVA
jgi:carboxymethylenebutenolidase